MINLLKNIFSFFFKKKCDTGLCVDPRTQEEKDKDHYHEEIQNPVSGFDISGLYLIKKPEVINVFVENQGATNTCVAHGTTLCSELKIQKKEGFFIRLSKAFIYRLRSNFPNVGMWLQNGFDILYNTGSCLYISLPTPSSESLCNSVIINQDLINEAVKFKSNYIFIKNFRDIDTLSSTAKDGTGIAITLFATRDEWSREYPIIKNPNLTFDQADVQHCVTIIPDSSFIENGIKYVTIIDSSHFGGIYLRRLSEQFINKRLTAAGYIIENKFKRLGDNPPKFIFNESKTLNIGQTSEDVKRLQQLLQYLGFFPADRDCTGYYGGITRMAVKAFQSAYSDQILKPLGLITPTGVAGSSTLSFINKQFGK